MFKSAPKHWHHGLDMLLFLHSFCELSAGLRELNLSGDSLKCWRIADEYSIYSSPLGHCCNYWKPKVVTIKTHHLVNQKNTQILLLPAPASVGLFIFFHFFLKNWIVLVICYCCTNLYGYLYRSWSFLKVILHSKWKEMQSFDTLSHTVVRCNPVWNFFFTDLLLLRGQLAPLVAQHPRNLWKGHVGTLCP